MKLTKGANATLAQKVIVADIGYAHRPAGLDVDLSAYLLTATRRVRGDDDMVFYNQTRHSSGAVEVDPMRSTVRIDTSLVPSDIERVAICTVIEEGRASQLGEIVIDVGDGPVFHHDVSEATEAAIIIAEVYRRNGEWKFRAVGQGFDGGLGPLARSFGMEVAEPAASLGEEVPKPAETVAPPVNLSKIDLRKHKVGVSLSKHGIANEKADVLFVIDASGSMDRIYRNGTIQETVERIVPVALRLDEDGRMDTWYYATRCRQEDPLDEHSMIGFVDRTMPFPGAASKGRGLFGKKKDDIGYGNNEPVVMNAILKKEPAERRKPLLILFLTDGGIDYSTSEEIKEILRKCAGQPIFWQFIGVGRADYGVLRDLDTIDGRIVDNAGFFSVDDLNEISDDELYDRLLIEFPSWLKMVKEKRILR